MDRGRPAEVWAGPGTHWSSLVGHAASRRLGFTGSAPLGWLRYPINGAPRIDGVHHGTDLNGADSPPSEAVNQLADTSSR